MRRRLLVVSIALVSILLTALMVPLVSTYAADRTQDLFVERGHVAAEPAHPPRRANRIREGPSKRWSSISSDTRRCTAARWS